MWIGLTDTGDEGKFVWMSDGTEVTYADWYKGQPNDWKKGQDCVTYYKNKWNDEECSERRQFLCQKGRIKGKKFFLKF